MLISYKILAQPSTTGVGINLQGVSAIHVTLNCAHSTSIGMPPRKILDFGPSEIFSCILGLKSKTSVHELCKTACVVLETYTLASVAL